MPADQAAVAVDQRRDVEDHFLECGPQADAVDETRAVGRQRDGGADLAQLGGLLVEVDLDAVLAQRQRERQPADPGADDGDAQGRGADEL